MKLFCTALVGSFYCLQVCVAQLVPTYIGYSLESTKNYEQYQHHVVPNKEHEGEINGLVWVNTKQDLPIIQLEGYYFNPPGEVDLSKKTFYVIDNVDDFERLFKPAPIMFGKLVTPIDFSRHFVVAVAVAGNFYPQFSGESLQKKGKMLTLAYHYKVETDSLDWSSVVAYAIVVEKSNISSVQFLENSKPIFKANLAVDVQD